MALKPSNHSILQAHPLEEEFPVSPLLKKAHPGRSLAPALTLAPAPSQDQALNSSPTNSLNNNNNEHKEE